MLVYGTYNSPLGKITVAMEGDSVVMLDFCDCAEKELLDQENFSTLFEELDKYFQGEPVNFKVPIMIRERGFRLRLFKEVRKIPWGKTVTYGQLAESLNSSPRAIGSSLSRNRILLLIPCHRVVGVRDLGGYKRGKELKEKLLKIEGIEALES